MMMTRLTFMLAANFNPLHLRCASIKPHKWIDHKNKPYDILRI
jgi:hypothetical protein